MFMQNVQKGHNVKLKRTSPEKKTHTNRDVSLNIYNKQVFGRRWYFYFGTQLFYFFSFFMQQSSSLIEKPGQTKKLLRYYNKSVPNRPRFFYLFGNKWFFVRHWRALVLKHTKQSTSKLLEFSFTMYTQYTRLETTYRGSGKIKKIKTIHA